MELRINDLVSPKTFCSTAKALPALNTDKQLYFEEVKAIKTWISEILTGVKTVAEVQAEIPAAFAGFGYRSDYTAQKKAHDAMRQILRYTESEKRFPLYLKEKVVPVAPGIEVKVRPDEVFWRNGSDENGKPMTFIEFVIIKPSLPKISQRKADQGASEALPLYALLQYGRFCKNIAENVYIKASYYYLRKLGDRQGSLDGTTPMVFKKDFFDLKGDGNIVSIGETWKSGKLDNTYVDQHTGKLVTIPSWDEVYQNAINRIKTGVEEKECSEKECSVCPYRTACKYEKPSLRLNEEKGLKHLPMLHLTPSQKQGIALNEGCWRVNAGAGTGKTMTMSLNIANLVADGANPEKILAITFTNTAAEELRERIRFYLDDMACEPSDADKMHICTFNGFGYEVVKAEYAELGFTAEPHVIDSVDRNRIIAKILNSNPEIDGLDYRNFTMNQPFVKGALVAVSLVFDIIKTYNLGMGDEYKISDLLVSEKAFRIKTSTIKELIGLYDTYDEYLRQENLIEFPDQLTMVEELLYKNPFYMEKYGFEHIVVDEFQDTDAQQLRILDALTNTPNFKSLVVVGDDSQAIFGFRHTSPEFIINLPDYLPGKEIQDLNLLENFRSSADIIDFANKINEMNPKEVRIEKDLIATKPHGEKVRVIPFFEKEREQQYVINSIKNQLSKGVKPEDIAIICMTKNELFTMGDLLTKEGVPSVLMNPQPIVENSRVLSAIAMVKALLDPYDTQDLFTYASALKEGGLIHSSVAEINDAILEANQKLDTVRKDGNEVSKKKELMNLLKELDKDEDEIYESFLDTLDFKPTADKIYEYVNDVMDYGQDTAVRASHSYPGIVLTTAHSSKGLEWNIVYNMISNYDDDKVHYSPQKMYERRRLLFVSATRAKDELYITGQAIAFKEKTEDGKANKIFLNEFLLNSYQAAYNKPLTNVDVIKAHSAYTNALDKIKKEKKRLEKEAKEKAERAKLLPMVRELLLPALPVASIPVKEVAKVIRYFEPLPCLFDTEAVFF